MKKISMFYFSGTGNTLYAAEYLSTILSKDSIVKNYSIEKISHNEGYEEIKKSDITVFLYPIYGSDLPDNMKQFILGLPSLNNKVCCVICTQFLFSGDGASVMHQVLMQKGYIQKWAFQLKMPNNLCMKGSPFKQISDYKELEKSLDKSNIKINHIANYINNDIKKIEDRSIFHNILGLLQRPAFRGRVKSHIQKSFQLDSKKCINCQICVKSCPAKVISIENDKVDYINRDKCLVCFRCINFCPKTAISYKGQIKKPQYKGPTKEIYKMIVK